MTPLCLLSVHGCVGMTPPPPPLVLILADQNLTRVLLSNHDNTLGAVAITVQLSDEETEAQRARNSPQVTQPGSGTAAGL